MSGASRRRSTSVGEGELLSSTLNLPEAVLTNRFNEFNPEKCVSTPQINTTGFTDDTYRNNRGTRFEPRIRTSSIDKRFREDFIGLKTKLSGWGYHVMVSKLTIDVIERQHNAFCIEIDQREREIGLAGEGLDLLDRYWSLRVGLNEVWRTIKQVLARARPDVSYNLDSKDEPTGLSCSRMVPSSKELSYSPDPKLMAIPEIMNHTELKADAEILADAKLMAIPELMADAEIMTDVELKADARLMADSKLKADIEKMADAEIMTDAELKADVEIMADARLMADSKLMAIPELMADTEMMADAKLRADAEIMTDAELKADVEIIADSELKADVEITADARLMADAKSNALVASDESAGLNKETTLGNLKPDFDSLQQEILKMDFFHDEKLCDFNMELLAPKCEDPNALIEPGEFASMDEMTTVWNLESRSNLLDEDLGDLTKECLSPSYVGPKTQYEQTCAGSVVKEGRTTVRNKEPRFDESYESLRDKGTTVWNPEPKLSLHDEKLSDLTKECLSLSCDGSKAQVESDIYLVEGRETTVWNLEPKLSVHDEKLSDLTKEGLSPSCVDPNALIEPGEFASMDEMTTVRNLGARFDSSKKRCFETRLFYDEKLSDLSAELGSPRCDDPIPLVRLDDHAMEDEGTTVWNLKPEPYAHDEKLSDLTKEGLSPSCVDPNALIETKPCLVEDEETTVRIRVCQEFAKPESLLDTNDALLVIFGLVAKGGRGVAELPDLDPELIIREETTVRNLDPSFGIDDENLSDLTEECYSPGCGGTRAQIEQTRSLLRDEETTVRNPVCKTQPTLDWMKSSKDDKFSGTMANAGRGVAELLVDPVSQGWRTKPSQKEFLKKTSEADNFKKNNDCKKSEDFRNDDGSDKTDSFKKTDDFKVDKFKKNNNPRGFKNDDGSDKTDGFKKTDDFRRTEDFKKNDIDFKKTDDPKVMGNPKNNGDSKSNAVPKNNGEEEISFELETNCDPETSWGPEKQCDVKFMSDQGPMSDLWLFLGYSGMDEIYWSGVWFGEIPGVDEISRFSESPWIEESLLAWIDEISWFEEISWSSESSWFEEIFWFDEMPWNDEISWDEKRSLSLEISSFNVIFWIEISLFGEVSWIGEISWSCEVSWYGWDSDKDELSPGLGELNLSKNLRKKTKLDFEPVKIGFSVVKFLMKLFTGPLRGKEWGEILPEEDVTFKGFLFQCRKWFLVQIQVLSRAKIQWSDDRVLRFPKDEDLENSRFGLFLEEIGEQTWSQPVFGTRSMVRSCGIKIRLLRFNISSTKHCEIRRRQVSFLEELTVDWSLKERTRWREVVPDLPSSKKRSGRKRMRSRSRAKPGKIKRRKLRSEQEKAKGEADSGVVGKDSTVRILSQPTPGAPGVVSGVGVLEDDLLSDEEMEDVVVQLSSDEEAPVVAKGGRDHAELIPLRRTGAAVRQSRMDAFRFRTYDERIEGDVEEVAFPDNLDFRFEIPKEVEDIEV